MQDVVVGILPKSSPLILTQLYKVTFNMLLPKYGNWGLEKFKSFSQTEEPMCGKTSVEPQSCLTPAFIHFPEMAPVRARKLS